MNKWLVTIPIRNILLVCFQMELNSIKSWKTYLKKFKMEVLWSQKMTRSSFLVCFVFTSYFMLLQIIWPSGFLKLPSLSSMQKEMQPPRLDLFIPFGSYYTMLLYHFFHFIVCTFLVEMTIYSKKPLEMELHSRNS